MSTSSSFFLSFFLSCFFLETGTTTKKSGLISFKSTEKQNLPFFFYQHSWFLAPHVRPASHI